MSKYDHAATMARLRKVRPNKRAAGMTATLERQRAAGKWRNTSSDAGRLAVYGTCDPLATSFPAIGKARCKCCNGSGRSGYEMTERGHLRLRKLRRAQAARTA